MVQGFVKQSGGDVQIDSELGRGTTIRVYLPADSASKEAQMQNHETNAATVPARETILAVEDDPRVRRVSLRRLKALGYKVIEADSGAAALAIMDHGASFDLRFTDVIMAGGMSGIELAQNALDKGPPRKVLFT